MPTTTPDSEVLFYEGTGNDVIEVQKPDELYFMHIEGNALSRYFGVTAYDDNGERLMNYVNTTNPYHGTRLLDKGDNEQTAMLEVKAEGKWTIELQPVRAYIEAHMMITPDQARDKPSLGQALPSEKSGTGDDVLVLVTGEGQAKIIKATHRGDTNFIVKAYSVEGGARYSTKSATMTEKPYCRWALYFWRCSRKASGP